MSPSIYKSVNLKVSPMVSLHNDSDMNSVSMLTENKSAWNAQEVDNKYFDKNYMSKNEMKNTRTSKSPQLLRDTGVDRRLSHVPFNNTYTYRAERADDMLETNTLVNRSQSHISSVSE